MPNPALRPYPTYRPVDTRWLYWEARENLVERPRPEYKPRILEGNDWLEDGQWGSREEFSRGTFCHQLADNFRNGLSTFFPAWLGEEGLAMDGGG